MANVARKSDPGFERDRTDAGLTGDKVAVSDPAAVPAHGDAESAGTPTTAADAMRSVHEQARISQSARPQAKPAPFASRRQPHTGSGRGVALAIASGVVLIVLGILAGMVSLASL